MRIIKNKALEDILFIYINLLFFVMKPFDVVLPCVRIFVSSMNELSNDMCHGTLIR